MIGVVLVGWMKWGFFLFVLGMLVFDNFDVGVFFLVFVFVMGNL